MIPLADAPRDPGHRPWATLALIAANVLVGLVTLPLAWVPWIPEAPLAWPPATGELDRLTWVFLTFGFRPSEPTLHATLTAMFVHGGGLHLAGNMLYLWIYGPNVERRLGRIAWVLTYLTTGVLGTLLYALTSLGSPIPAVGASGAISGLLGAYLVLFPLNTVRVLVVFTVLEVPAWLVLALFVVVDNVAPFVLDGTSSTAHAAHLGGFFVGMLLAAGVRVLQPSIEPSRRAARGDPLARPLRLVRQGMLVDAHLALTELARSGQPGVADAARRHLEELEASPDYQRAAHRRR